jgi:hypothetical protein
VHKQPKKHTSSFFAQTFTGLGFLYSHRISSNLFKALYFQLLCLEWKTENQTPTMTFPDPKEPFTQATACYVFRNLNTLHIHLTSENDEFGFCIETDTGTKIIETPPTYPSRIYARERLVETLFLIETIASDILKNNTSHRTDQSHLSYLIIYKIYLALSDKDSILLDNSTPRDIPPFDWRWNL